MVRTTYPAGYGLFGAIEEVSEAEARQQIETNQLHKCEVAEATYPTQLAQS